MARTLQKISPKGRIMVLLFSVLIVAVSSVAILLLLTWFVQYATGWLLPSRKTPHLPLTNHNPRPYHARG
jgi:hypothetical protein